MILLNLWAIPRTSDVVLELVGVDENQRAQERDEYYQAEVKETEERIHLEDRVDQAQGHAQGAAVVPESKLMLHQVSENWDESKDAEGDIEQGENLGGAV